MHLTAERLDRIQPSLTIAIATKARHMIAEGKNVISLSQGEPDSSRRRATSRMRPSGPSRRARPSDTDVAGTPELRKAVADEVQADSWGSTTNRRRSSSPPVASR